MACLYKNCDYILKKICKLWSINDFVFNFPIDDAGFQEKEFEMQAYPEVLDDPEGNFMSMCCNCEMNYTVINHIVIGVCCIDLLLYIIMLYYILSLFLFTLIKLLTHQNYCQLLQWTRQLHGETSRNLSKI